MHRCRAFPVFFSMNPVIKQVRIALRARQSGIPSDFASALARASNFFFVSAETSAFMYLVSPVLRTVSTASFIFILLCFPSRRWPRRTVPRERDTARQGGRVVVVVDRSAPG